jgi:hypothetical protein
VDEREDAGEPPRPAPFDAGSGPGPDASGGTCAGPDVPGSARDASGGGWDACDKVWDELPRRVPEDDFDADAEMARWVADLEAGRERIPEEWETGGAAISLSLGDACDLHPALLAAMLGPGGLGGQSLSPVFGQDAAADALRPGPVLAALTEQAVSDLAVLSDDQLTGALQAARRLENRASYLQTVGAAASPSSTTPRPPTSPRGAAPASS